VEVNRRARGEEVDMISRTIQNVYAWVESVTFMGLPPKDPNDDDEENEEEEGQDEQEE
jgi:hypothetical protein